MRWWSLPTKCWELSTLTAVRVGTWGYSVLHSNSSIILPLQTHAVFWSSRLRRIVVPKQITAAQLESQLHSGQQPQIPSVTLKQSGFGSGEEKTIWSVTGRRPSSSCAFHISLNCISYHQRAGEANCSDVNRTPPSRLRVMEGLLLLRDLEQCLEWAQAASLDKHSCSWTGSRASGDPVSHQISQAPRSNSSKSVQSKHCDSEKDKLHRKPKESLKKWHGNISLGYLLPQLDSSFLYKHKVMRSWEIEKLCRKDGMCSHSKKELRNPSPEACLKNGQFCLQEFFQVVVLPECMLTLFVLGFF